MTFYLVFKVKMSFFFTDWHWTFSSVLNDLFRYQIPILYVCLVRFFRTEVLSCSDEIFCFAKEFHA